MKNQNTLFIAIAFALAFALAPVTKAAPSPGGIPTPGPAASPANAPAAAASSTSAEDEQSDRPTIPPPPFPVVTIHSAGNILRGKTGSFVLVINPALPVTYVNFSVSGTAVAGVDYVPLLSPAYIGQPGYGVILLKTLPDPRGSFNRQAYSVVVTLEPGAGYVIGAPSSALIWIKP